MNPSNADCGNRDKRSLVVIVLLFGFCLFVFNKKLQQTWYTNTYQPPCPIPVHVLTHCQNSKCSTHWAWHIFALSEDELGSHLGWLFLMRTSCRERWLVEHIFLGPVSPMVLYALFILKLMIREESADFRCFISVEKNVANFFFFLLPRGFFSLSMSGY